MSVCGGSKLGLARTYEMTLGGCVFCAARQNGRRSKRPAKRREPEPEPEPEQLTAMQMGAQPDHDERVVVVGGESVSRLEFFRSPFGSALADAIVADDRWRVEDCLSADAGLASSAVVREWCRDVAVNRGAERVARFLGGREGAEGREQQPRPEKERPDPETPRRPRSGSNRRRKRRWSKRELKLRSLEPSGHDREPVPSASSGAGPELLFAGLAGTDFVLDVADDDGSPDLIPVAAAATTGAAAAPENESPETESLDGGPVAEAGQARARVCV